LSRKREGMAAEWADIGTDEVQALTLAAERVGWRPALESYRTSNPFFVRRLTSLALANWHLLLAKPRRASALDVGCGFGTLTLGLGRYFDRAAGLDFLPDRVRFASLRASQEGQSSTSYSVGSALELSPATHGRFDLVILNGVLEWAGLFGDGDPRALQARLMARVREVLAPGGHAVVAIENRFAMETLAGMPDTHTGMHFIPALPSALAKALYRLWKGKSLRSWLWSLGGYERLFRAVGFEGVRILETVSSYNDYDFILDTREKQSYDFLWRIGAVRGFNPRAHRWRAALGRRWPGALKQFAYSFLVIGGATEGILLDAGHAFWAQATRLGAAPGAHRFACSHELPGCIFLVAHDGRRLVSVVEYGAALPAESGPVFERLPQGFREIGRGLVLRGAEVTDGVELRAYSPA
jgi:SAM-dependent methyltransferase